MPEKEYYLLVEKVYTLISSEIDHYLETNDPDGLRTEFAKFPIMFEFFRFLRGESFHKTHPPYPEVQPVVYEMENKLRQKIRRILDKVNYKSSDSRFYLKQYKRIFDKKYY